MPIKISGVDVSKVLVGSGGGASPAQKIMLGTGSSAVQVWPPDPRIVKISSASNGQYYSWTASSAVGDTEIIQSLTSDNVRFSVDVTSDKIFGSYSAGNTIPAATIIRPSASTGTATFTEVV